MYMDDQQFQSLVVPMLHHGGRGRSTRLKLNSTIYISKFRWKDEEEKVTDTKSALMLRVNVA